MVCFRCEALGLISRCLFVKPREATEEEILTKHSVEQVEILKATNECRDEEYLEELSSRYDAIYIHPVSRKFNGADIGNCRSLKLTLTIVKSHTAFMTICGFAGWVLV